jgi:hypothetical protein
MNAGDHSMCRLILVQTVHRLSKFIYTFLPLTQNPGWRTCRR